MSKPQEIISYSDYQCMKNELQQLIDKTLDLPPAKSYWYGYDVLNQLIPKSFLFFVKRTHHNEIVNEHHRIIVAFYLKGDAEVIVEGNQRTIPEGTLTAYLPHQSHGHYNSNDVLHLYLSFEAEPGAYEELRDKIIEITPEINNHLNKSLENYLLEANPLKLQRAYLHIQFLLLEILNEVIDDSEKYGSEEKSPIALATHYVFKHLNTPLKIDDIANFCGLSESHLRKLFRDNMKMSIGQWIKINRLQRSRTLLTTTNLSIKEIAYECGYQTPSRYCDNFKKLTGQTTRQYRLSHK